MKRSNPARFHFRFRPHESRGAAARNQEKLKMIKYDKKRQIFVKNKQQEKEQAQRRNIDCFFPYFSL